MNGRTKLRLLVVAIATSALSVISVGAAVTPALARAACTVSDQWGSCQPGSGLANFTAYNNVWNPGDDPDRSQTLTATNNTQWSVSSAIDGTQVVSYPESATTYAVPKPVSSYTSLISQWHSGLPAQTPGDRYEFAYDEWLDSGPGGASAKEVMVWTQNYGQSPGGTDRGSWTDPTFGNVYEVWSNSGTVWFVCDTGSHTGSVNMKAALATAIKYEWPGDQGILVQSSYGAEVVTTQDVAKTFYLYGLNFITS